MNPLTLTPDERARMKTSMRAFMDAHPLPDRRPLASPFARVFRIAAPAMAALLVFSGSAFAAEQSLPNDFLYPMKTQVLEPIVFSSLSFTPAAKARANSALASRRYDEAEALITQGELGDSDAAELQRSIDEHTDAAQQYIKETAASGDVLGALDLGSDLETIIDAHSEIISSLADEYPSPAADDLSDKASDQSEETEDLGDALQDQLPAEPADDRAAFARDAASEANDAIADLTSGVMSSDRDESLVQSASDLLAHASSSYQLGRSAIDTGDFSGSIPHFQEAIESANQALILLDTSDELADTAE